MTLLWGRHQVDTYLPVLLNCVKVVEELAKGLILRPLSTAYLGVSPATVHPSQVLHGHHAIPSPVQLGKGSSNDSFSGLRHGGLKGTEMRAGDGAPPQPLGH